MYRITTRYVAGIFAATFTIGSIGVSACTNRHANLATDPSTTAADSASSPKIIWGPAPAIFQPGAEMAVVQGDPSKSEPFIIRLRLPDGYKIAPHTHPTDENVTVISGVFKVGMGGTFSTANMLSLPRGAFVSAPALHAHFGMAQGATIVQVNAIGPFALTYVNASDIPKPVSR